jgi:hypothetical protein
MEISFYIRRSAVLFRALGWGSDVFVLRNVAVFES